MKSSSVRVACHSALVKSLAPKLIPIGLPLPSSPWHNAYFSAYISAVSISSANAFEKLKQEIRPNNKKHTVALLLNVLLLF
jgi:hypothetical protein|tara:strand:+ start:314 stop:556 length:243 start_codon:yes stop_codon:yes gene_type:complete